MFNFDNHSLFIIFFSILIGGIVKGSVGIGMSMFSVPIIAFILPPTTAMMLLCFPVLVTNFLQMKVQKGIGSIRFLPMYIALIFGLLIGGKLILNLDFSSISKIIAITIIVTTVFNFFGLSIKNIKNKYEKVLTIFLGFFSGILGGLSTFYAPPLIAYLVSANLEKEFFIRTVASMYFVGSIPLYSSLIYHGLGTASDLLMSSCLVIPAIMGQFFGTKIRNRLSNTVFRKCTLIVLLVIGLSLLIKNI